MAQLSVRPAPATVDASIQRGLEWVDHHLAATGQVGGSDQADLYFKLPSTLMVAGRLNQAYKVLEWADRHLLDDDHRLQLPPEVEPRRPVNSYDRGWLVWGATLCERYDVAEGLAQDTLAHQDPRTGGFYDHLSEKQAGAGGLGGMTAGMAGLGLLATGHVAEAQQAAEFLEQLMDAQTGPDEGMFTYLEIDAAGATSLRSDKASVNYVDLHGKGQRPARFGPAQALLVRLHRLTGDPRPLQTCRRYCDLFLTGNEEVFLSVECHKYTWGLAELYQVTGDERYREAADACATYLTTGQQRDGSWLAESSAPGPGTQSLPLILGTTCNALVGLCYHRAFLR